MLNPFHQNAENKELKSKNSYKGHTGSVETVRFDTFDQNKFFSGSHDHTVKLWDVNTTQCIQTIKNHTSGVWCIDVSPTDKLLASTSPDATIVISDSSSGKKVMEFKADFVKGYWVEFSPNGNSIVASGMDGSVQLFDVRKGALIKDYKIDNTIVYNTKYRNDAIIVSCTSQGEILYFDSALNLIDKYQVTNKEIRSVCFKNDNLFTSFYDNKVRELSLDVSGKSLTAVSEFDAHINTINVLEASKDRDLLFTGSKDSTLHAWSTNPKTFKNNLVGHTDQISDIRLSKDGGLLVAASWDQSLRVYDISQIIN